MISVSRFIAQVEKIAARDLAYKTGGVGKNGVCDCIGLIMGAMYELGHAKYDLHSTNYFARYQTLEMKKANEKDLFVGQILYRSRTNQDKLNGRYLPGGRYYTGDLLDHYHVSVVVSVNPIRIIECTEYGGVSGIVVNSSFKNWDYGGKLRGVDYAVQDETEDEAVEVESVLYKAMVVTQEDPLTLRNAPVSGKKIGEMPKGAIVEVMSTGDWSRVRYDDVLGYASAQYLERIEEEEMEVQKVTIVDSEGNRFEPVGDFRVLFGSID